MEFYPTWELPTKVLGGHGKNNNRRHPESDLKTSSGISTYLNVHHIPTETPHQCDNGYFPNQDTEKH